MLELFLDSREVYLDDKNLFVTTKPMTLRLEHSLVSIAKWETKWRKPFLDRSGRKTYEESIDYIRCMTINQNVDPVIYYSLTSDEIKKINDYIDTDFTATTFKNTFNAPSNEIITSELIYYQLVAFRIPFECQKWNFSRLLALLQICRIKSEPGKKMSKQAIMNQNRALNAARRKKLHSKG